MIFVIISNQEWMVESLTENQMNTLEEHMLNTQTGAEGRQVGSTHRPYQLDGSWDSTTEIQTFPQSLKKARQSEGSWE